MYVYEFINELFINYFISLRWQLCAVFPYSWVDEQYWLNLSQNKKTWNFSNMCGLCEFSTRNSETSGGQGGHWPLHFSDWGHGPPFQKSSNFRGQHIPLRQPPYVAQARWLVPMRHFLLSKIWPHTLKNVPLPMLHLQWKTWWLCLSFTFGNPCSCSSGLPSVWQ